jgi:hypothetical protein
VRTTALLPEFGLELLAVILISLVPTVPVAVLGWAIIRRTRRRGGEDIASGQAPETPFAALSVVGLVITVAVVFFLSLTLVARWLV